MSKKEKMIEEAKKLLTKKFEEFCDYSDGSEMGAAVKKNNFNPEVFVQLFVEEEWCGEMD